jgi:deoxyribonuclease-4
MKIGVHLSISGGLYRALEKSRELNIQAVQIFLKNSNQWKAKPYSADDIRKFLDVKSSMPDLAVFAHSGYLINLAGSGAVRAKSINALADELNRAEQLGIEYVTIHPGSHKGRGIDEGIERVAEACDRVFEKNPTTKILLETTAGQGASIGHRFEQIRSIIDASSHPDRLAVCMDTCHVFAAGYDISTKAGYPAVMSEFNDIIGLKKLRLIHLNDSVKKCGSRVDRHEHIGKGSIGNEGFRLLLHDLKLKDIPMILETPKFNDDEADRMNLRKIRSLMKQKSFQGEVT